MMLSALPQQRMRAKIFSATQVPPVLLGRRKRDPAVVAGSTSPCGSCTVTRVRLFPDGTGQRRCYVRPKRR